MKIKDKEKGLSELDTIKNLLAKREGHEDELKRKNRKLPGTINLMKSSINPSWKILIQPLVNRKMKVLEQHSKKENEFKNSIKLVENNIPHDIDRLNHADGSVPCPTCERNRDALSDEERAGLTVKLDDAQKELHALKYELEGVEGSQSKMSQLSRYKSDLNPTSIMALESSISTDLEEIEVLKGLISTCNDALGPAGNVAGFGKLSDAVKLLRNDFVLMDRDRKQLQSEESGIQIKLQKLRSRLSRGGGAIASDLDEIENKIKALEWFENIWNLSLDRFRENIRESINAVCTDRFLEWVDDSEKYSHIETTPSWGLNVYGADKNWAPLANPGHRQLLSICFIEALRHCSQIEFPMIFDNPGAAVDQETIQGILNYYFKNPPGQFLALSHSGGMRESEIISQYQESGFLSKAWRISYEGGSGRHSKFEIL